MRDKFINEIHKYEGCKFFYKGRTKAGIDCAGLYIIGIRKIKDLNYEFLDYSLNPSKNLICNELERYCKSVTFPQVGDILLLRLRDEKEAKHIAFYSYNNKIIHTYRTIKKVIVEEYSEYWKNRTELIYRIQ